jgi:hypothetical protein
MRNLLKIWCCNCVRVQGKYVQVLASATDDAVRDEPGRAGAGADVAAALPVASGDSIYAQRPS